MLGAQTPSMGLAYTLGDDALRREPLGAPFGVAPTAHRPSHSLSTAGARLEVLASPLYRVNAILIVFLAMALVA